MPRSNSITIIGTTDFSHCRFLTLDAQRVISGFRGSVIEVASGDFHAQRWYVGQKLRFGLSAPSAEAALILAAVAEIQASELANGSFIVRAKDALYDIHAYCIPDYDVDWFTHGPESEGVISNVVFRFVAQAPYIP